jgi:hypothetical protein
MCIKDRLLRREYDKISAFRFLLLMNSPDNAKRLSLCLLSIFSVAIVWTEGGLYLIPDSIRTLLIYGVFPLLNKIRNGLLMLYCNYYLFLILFSYKGKTFEGQYK